MRDKATLCGVLEMRSVSNIILSSESGDGGGGGGKERFDELSLPVGIIGLKSRKPLLYSVARLT